MVEVHWVGPQRGCRHFRVALSLVAAGWVLGLKVVNAPALCALARLGTNVGRHGRAGRREVVSSKDAIPFRQLWLHGIADVNGSGGWAGGSVVCCSSGSKSSRCNGRGPRTLGDKRFGIADRTRGRRAGPGCESRSYLTALVRLLASLVRDVACRRSFPAIVGRGVDLLGSRIQVVLRRHPICRRVVRSKSRCHARLSIDAGGTRARNWGREV